MKFLEQLVPQHVIKPHWSNRLNAETREFIDWQAIGKQIKRVPNECSNKWIDVQASRLKQGRFSAEEDALIRQRVAAWGDKGNGLWVSLQQELGRAASVIQARWATALADRYIAVPGETYFVLGQPCKTQRFEWKPELVRLSSKGAVV